MDTKNKQLTVTQFAKEAGVTVGYIRQLLAAKRIKGIKLGERAWVLQSSELRRMDKLATSKRGRKRISEK